MNCELLSHIRNFKAWMEPLCLNPYNCWVPRHGNQTPAPHSFTFKLRMDLTQQERDLLQEEPQRLDLGHDALDVFCIAKTYMSSRGPNGPPVLLLPNSRYCRVQEPGPTGSCYATRAMTARRKQHLQNFAAALEAFTAEWAPEHSYFRAARELRILANGRDEYASADGFLESADAARESPIEASAENSVEKTAQQVPPEPSPPCHPPPPLLQVFSVSATLQFKWPLLVHTGDHAAWRLRPTLTTTICPRSPGACSSTSGIDTRAGNSKQGACWITGPGHSRFIKNAAFHPSIIGQGSWRNLALQKMLLHTYFVANPALKCFILPCNGFQGSFSKRTQEQTCIRLLPH